MPSPESPEEHIKRIRAGKLVDNQALCGVNQVVRDGVSNLHCHLQSALIGLTDELNSREGHFFLELLQNAEDNKYASGVKPQVTISTRKLSAGPCIIFECNEIGFSPRDVGAICSIGQSTKKNQLGFIGEKGIGFKSVFRVANKVYIASGGYTFYFNDDERLGKIAPHWVAPESFPYRELNPAQTTIVLLLRKELTSEIGDLHDNLLLFLRKVSVLEIKSAGTTKYVRDGDATDVKIIKTVGSGTPITKQYKLFRKLVNMEGISEEKRKGIRSVELVLAFPHENAEPIIDRSCNVFAFLPLRSYNFRFIIQSDFLTQTSREGILTDKAWNIRIAQAIPDAFIDALPLLKSHPKMAESFLDYVPTTKEVTDVFFEEPVTQLFTKLKQSPIIRTIDGDWVLPARAIACPEKFMATDKQPLIPNDAVKKYIKMAYRDPKQKVPQRLWKDNALSLSQFLDCLEKYDCSHNSPKWFEKLYEALASCRFDHVDRKKKPIKDFNIFLLDSGASITNSQLVVNMQNRTVFFTSDTIEHAPDKSFCFIHPNTHRSAQAHSFLEKLGVKTADPKHIAEGLVKLHKSWGKGAIPRNDEEVAGHLFFVWRNLDAITKDVLQEMGQELMVRAEGADCYYSPVEMYLPTNAMKSLLDGEDGVAFVHPHAVDAQADTGVLDEKYFGFLSQLGVQDKIRVLRESSEGRGEFTSEFLSVVSKKEKAMQLLDMMKENWAGTYAAYAKPTRANRAFIDKISNMEVPCMDEEWRKLKDTFLKREGIISVLGAELPFLDVPQLDDKGWNFLESFGVGVKPNNPSTLTKRLEQLAPTHEQVGRETAERIYREFARMHKRGREVDRTPFETSPIILIPETSTTPATSVSSADCRWSKGDAAICHPSIHIMSQHFPKFEYFFVEVLGIGNLNIRDSGVALEQLVSKPSPHTDEDIRMYWKIMGDIGFWIEEREGKRRQVEAGEVVEDEEGGGGSNNGPGAETDEEWIKNLLAKPIFYTRMRDGSKDFVASTGWVVTVDGASLDYVHRFQNEVDLLAIPPEEMARVRPLLQKVQPKILWLKDLVKPTCRPMGTKVRDTGVEETIRKLAPFIERLVYNHSASHHGRTSPILRTLATIDAFNVSSLQCTLTVEYQDKRFASLTTRNVWVEKVSQPIPTSSEPPTTSLYMAFPPETSSSTEKNWDIMQFIAKYAKIPNEVLHCVFYLMGLASDEKREKILQGMGVAQLPQRQKRGSTAEEEEEEEEEVPLKRVRLDDGGDGTALDNPARSESNATDEVLDQDVVLEDTDTALAFDHIDQEVTRNSPDASSPPGTPGFNFGPAHDDQPAPDESAGWHATYVPTATPPANDDERGREAMDQTGGDDGFVNTGEGPSGSQPELPEDWEMVNAESGAEDGNDGGEVHEEVGLDRGQSLLGYESQSDARTIVSTEEFRVDPMEVDDVRGYMHEDGGATEEPDIKQEPGLEDGDGNGSQQDHVADAEQALEDAEGGRGRSNTVGSEGYGARQASVPEAETRNDQNQDGQAGNDQNQDLQAENDQNEDGQVDVGEWDHQQTLAEELEYRDASFDDADAEADEGEPPVSGSVQAVFDYFTPHIDDFAALATDATTSPTHTLQYIDYNNHMPTFLKNLSNDVLIGKVPAEGGQRTWYFAVKERPAEQRMVEITAVEWEKAKEVHDDADQASVYAVVMVRPSLHRRDGEGFGLRIWVDPVGLVEEGRLQERKMFEEM
ncbi:hypothetical protein HDV00_005003 [Rhizophlyctis rosea]|nr:hypothetical protein HDV00_005003 [Rhizophlyctis rosea]